MNTPPLRFSREVQLRAHITVIKPAGTCYELTHFCEIEQGKRREGLDGDENVMHGAKGILCALAVAKFLIPHNVDAFGSWKQLPLQDEAGAAEALNERKEIVRVILHQEESDDLLAAPQPFSPTDQTSKTSPNNTMGAPQLPNIPTEWIYKTTMKALLTRPGMEDVHGCWIEELSAWIAVDEEDADFIREVLPDAKILLPADLGKLDGDKL